MLLDHYNVDAFWVFKGKETEASRSSGGGVTHDSALADFAKL